MVNNNKVTSFVNALNGLVDGKEDVSNKVTSISSSSTNAHYPTAKAVYDALAVVTANSGGNYIYDFYHDPSTDDIVLEYDSASGGGSGGGSSVDIVTSWEQTLSDEKVPSEKLVKDSLDLKSDSTHTHSQYLTEHQSLTNYVQKSSTTGLLKNDGTVDTTSYSTFDGNYNNLSNKPTIPSASTTTPSADTTSGSYGSGTTYARSNHTHPKSSLYAENSHTHTYSNINNVSTVSVTVTYTDNSTETINLLRYTGS